MVSTELCSKVITMHLFLFHRVVLDMSRQLGIQKVDMNKDSLL
uniref:Uncharacterized protein n=1 Tax=Manihot esculenta TaxID=3983 RepID=A0A2C9WKA7_MANES